MLEQGADPAVLSLREVARRAGVSAMAPYRHFADKDALLAAVATIGFDRLAEALRLAERDLLGRAALIAQGVAYVVFACANPALFRLMFGAAVATKEGDLARAGMATFGVLADRVATVSPAGGAPDWALASWALVHGLAMLAVDGQLTVFDASPAAVAERITTLMTNGMR